jgi:mono/diheme cytochrome c family protein
MGLWAAAAAAQEPTVSLPEGARLYQRNCAPCHGASGGGDGPDAALFAAHPRDLRQGFLGRYPTAELVRRIRDGQPLRLELDVPALRAHASETAALAAFLRRMPSIDWALVEGGKAIYAERCVNCHGRFGVPPAILPPGVRRPADLSSGHFQATTSDAELIELVRHGRERMPALTPRIPTADGPALAAFVRLLSPGFATYERYCAPCHGDDGRGTGAIADTEGGPKVSFDAAYFTRHDPEQLQAAVWHMLAVHKPSMPHYRWQLSEAQATAIVNYLQSLNRQ